MSTTPPPSSAPDDATPHDAVPASSVPDDAPSSEQIDEIAEHAVPATIRRAPKYSSFFWMGALVGIVVGVWFGLWVSDDGMVNRWIYVTVTALGVTMVTVLLAGLAAVWADRRSIRAPR